MWGKRLRRARFNNLVKTLHLFLSDLYPVLSVTLEGLWSWVIKGDLGLQSWTEYMAV